jgi:hypothetical protein
MDEKRDVLIGDVKTPERSVGAWIGEAPAA